NDVHGKTLRSLTRSARNPLFISTGTNIPGKQMLEGSGKYRQVVPPSWKSWLHRTGQMNGVPQYPV
ncbi:MAG: hypothetical protein RQ767_06245, partial [Thermovirgaceae bacterium]|nr:hypothetical protein [Thermovirgaceae bacterium]